MKQLHFLLLQEFNYSGEKETESHWQERDRKRAAAAREFDKYQSDRVTRLAGLNYEAHQVKIAPAARPGPC